MFISANPDDDFISRDQQLAIDWYKQAKAYQRDLENLQHEHTRLIGQYEALVCRIADLEYELKERS